MIEIPLTQGNVALIDDEDAHLAQFKWYARRDGRRWYALRKASRRGPDPHKTLMLHREVLGVQSGVHVDHANGDGLDCRRGNLRVATKSQNAANQPRSRKNTSGFKGVFWSPRARVWQAEIKVNDKRARLGRFLVPEDAARAYDDAARTHFGAFAALNFPRQNERAA